MPDAPAVSFEGASLTYAELDTRANRLAHRLRTLGVGPETRVGVCLERCPELVVSLLGTLKAGGAYVPVDPDYPAERIAYMLADSGVSVVLTLERLAGSLPEHGARVVRMDADWSEIAAESPRSPDVEVAPESLAYVIHTSGSTGRPKGAMNEHRGIVNRLLWMQEEYGLGADDVVLQKTPLSFDVSVWELFWPLITGARLVLARPGGHRDPRYLSELIERERVTTLHFVPPMLQAFLEAGEPARCGSLRRIVCSGEALPYPLMERCLDALAAAGVHNLYGPTEAAVDVTYWACARRERRTVPIGRPVANTRIYVVDAAFGLAPVGVPGELCIGGVQVGRGYLGRPRLTAAKFAPDPFSAAAGARLYRTGDRVRWTVEGELEYLGRIDFQVKVRGFRIEPGEVEATLLRIAGMKSAVVVAREDRRGDRRLIAYLVADGAFDPGALRAGLGETLPEHMVPSAFVRVDAIPLTPSGKVDRARLPAPGISPGEERREAPPRTPVEEVLAGIWAEALGLERVGVHDSFFDVGGHSLLAGRVVSRIRDVFGVEVPLRTLFGALTVAELAERVEALRRAGLPALPPVVPVDRDAPPPLSFGQERLWFIDRLQGGSPFYNLPVALRLEGALEAAALERALGEVVRRHEALRTTFADERGVPVQVIAPFRGFTLPVEDLSDRGGEAAREARARRRAGEEGARPFDLAAGPLFRATLLRLRADDHVLLLCTHHIAADGWSVGVLFRELAALYAAYRDGREPLLAEPPVQYADYAVWQHAQMRGEALERQLVWWTARLAGAPALLELPADRPRPAVQTYRGGRERLELPGELLERLQALGRSEGATLFMVLLGAFQVLLGRYAGSDDVVVGSPVAGRARSEVEGLIGFFANTLVLRVDLSGDPTFRQVLRRVREGTLGAYEHADLPFEKLVAELQPERSLGHAPLCQAAFSLAHGAVAPAEVSGLRVRPLDVDTGTARWDLHLELAPYPGGIRGVLSYSADLFERATIERMGKHLVQSHATCFASGSSRSHP